MANVKWNLDPTHSEIQFKVKHLMITNVTGNFTDFTVEAESEDEKFKSPKVSFSAKIASINTSNEQRDGHLKSADFFDVAKYPNMTFKSTSFKKTSGNNYKLTGDLTIKGVTKKVTFDVTYGGTVKDPYGNTKAGFKVKGSIKRMEYGLTWSALTEAGGMVVGDEVAIMFNIELAKAK